MVKQFDPDEDWDCIKCGAAAELDARGHCADCRPGERNARKRKVRRPWAGRLYDLDGQRYTCRELARKAKVSVSCMKKRLQTRTAAEAVAPKIPHNLAYNRNLARSIRLRSEGKCIRCAGEKEPERAKVSHCLACKESIAHRARTAAERGRLRVSAILESVASPD